jgi:hypothetical protein
LCCAGEVATLFAALELGLALGDGVAALLHAHAPGEIQTFGFGLPVTRPARATIATVAAAAIPSGPIRP